MLTEPIRGRIAYLQASIPLLTGSAGIVLASQGASILLRLVSTIIFTRLLAPEAFGEILVVSTITGLITLCSEIGLRGSIINNDRGMADPKYVNTAWTLRIAQYLLVAMALLVASFFVHRLYPAIANIDNYLRICALTALLTGFTSTKVFQQEKLVRPAGPAAIVLVERLFALLVAILLCYFWPNAGSVLWANAIAMCLTVLLTHQVLPGISNRICLERSAIKTILDYGKWMLPATIVTWAIRDGYKLALSFFLLPTALGFFAIASNIGLVLAMVLREFSEKWLFPVYCRNKGNHDSELQSARIRAAILAVSIVVITGLVYCSEILVEILYTPEFKTVADFLSVIALGSGGLIVTALYLPVLKGNADSRRVFLVRLIQFGTLAAGMLLAFRYGDSAHVVGATAAAQLLAGILTILVAMPYFTRKVLLIDGLLFTTPLATLLPGYIGQLSLSLAASG
ncbi:oligosaccharide flippase family protein [Microbulbifer sp. M83]|uniref:oligosaccharide flippase family protein n=1 Tax=unclassified Microbulbifer TaxID=2619833 RepID=UPI002FDFFF6F